MTKAQRLIDAMRLVTKLAKRVRFGRIKYDDVLAVIAEAPTVEVMEVVHGRWVIERSPVEAEFKCSACGYSYIDGDSCAKAEYNYCPNCGARMDGERREGE